MPILNKDMQVCISLAARPSNLGTRFHNFLYDELGLNFIYKAFTTSDLVGAVAGVRALGIRGCSVSMPFKEDIIKLVDAMLPSAQAIESVNTVVNDNGVLTASNTDYQAILDLIQMHNLNRRDSVLVRGSGGMAKAVVAAFNQAGFENLTVLARNEVRGKALASRYGFQFSDDALFEAAVSEFDILVNVTPLGMTGEDQQALAFPELFIESARVVFDVVAFPSDTPLISLGQQRGKKVISGAEVSALQAALQFETYTGVQLTEDQISRAARFSRET